MACGCGAFDNFCSELQANAPLCPGLGGAGVNIDWCIMVRVLIYFVLLRLSIKASNLRNSLAFVSNF